MLRVKVKNHEKSLQEFGQVAGKNHHNHNYIFFADRTGEPWNWRILSWKRPFLLYWVLFIAIFVSKMAVLGKIESTNTVSHGLRRAFRRRVVGSIRGTSDG